MNETQVEILGMMSRSEDLKFQISNFKSLAAADRQKAGQAITIPPECNQMPPSRSVAMKLDPGRDAE
jgi:hypothetical protein